MNNPQNFKWPDGRNRQVLPIDGHLQKILDALDSHQVVVVEAETGAGKTTRIPQAIITSNPSTTVWMTQTRRPAVRWNGKRIAEEMGQAPGGAVGWQLRGERKVRSRQTRLTLVIDQTLVNMIRRNGRLPEGVLIIDEAHERQISTDLLLGLIKQYLPESPNTRVLITSATIDTAKFAEYFGGAPVVSVPGRMFPVEINVRKMAYAEHHSNEAIAAAREVMGQFVKGELTIADTSGEGRQTVISGSILVLLPGKEDIKNAMTSLNRKAEELALESQVEILACHSEISSAEQDAVARRVPKGMLRFVCATEIVRSSVTVPQTVGVIDSLQVKRLMTDAKGVAHLTKVAVSKAEADQAKGRAGRTQPGFYIPVSFKSEYAGLALWPEPSILREPIASVVLQVAAQDLDIRSFPFIDRPDEDKINVAVTRLQKLGALTESEEITRLGRLLVRFPVDPERSRVLVTANGLGVLAEAIVAAAVLEVENIVFRPKDRDETVQVSESILRQVLVAGSGNRYFGEGDDREYRKPRVDEVDLEDLPRWAKALEGGVFELDCSSYNFPFAREGARTVADLVWREFAAGTGSDFVASVNAYRAFKQEEYRLRGLARVDDERGRRWVDDQMFAWCKRHFLNLKRLRMVEFTIQQLREEVAASPLKLENGINNPRDFSSEALTKSLASGMVDNVCRNAGRRSFNGPLGDSLQLAYGSACSPDAELILIGGVHKIPSGRRRTSLTLLADMAAPVQPDWLAEVMPQLCEPTLRDGSARFNPETGLVDGIEDVYYGNVVITSNAIQVTGELGAEMIASAMIGTQTGLPVEWVAKYFRDQVYELTMRDGAQKTIQTEVKDWLIQRLGTAATRDQARKLDLRLTEDEVSEMLGFDYPAFRERVRSERPEFWQIGQSLHRLVYSSLYGEKPVQVKIFLPLLLARRVQLEQLPAWDNSKVLVYVDHPDYRNVYVNAEELEQLASKIEVRRLELAWDRFMPVGLDPKEKFEVEYQESLPTLPQAQVWDRLTGSKAYPAWVHDTWASDKDGQTTWEIRWFQTWEAARDARNQAKAKLAEKQAAEYEKRHYDEFKAEAQALYREVEGQWLQVELERYQAYGLSQEEAGKSWGSTSASLKSRLENARELAGLGAYSYNLAPRKALEALSELKVRIEGALAAYAQNEESRPEAEAVLEAAKQLVNQLNDAVLYGASVGWDNQRVVEGKVREVERAFERSEYVAAVELAREADDLAQPLVKAAEAQLAREQLLDGIVAEKYQTCPVCGEDISWLSDSTVHDCPRQEELLAAGQKQDVALRESREAGSEEPLLVLVARYVPRYDEYQVELRKDQAGTVTDPELISTVTLWQTPDARTFELARLREELMEREQLLGGLEQAWEYDLQAYEEAEEAALERLMAEFGTRPIAEGDVFEVTFHEEERQGQSQLVAGPIFDEPSGSWIKLVEDPYHSLQPQLGVKQLVRVRAKNSEQIHLFAYRVDNPQGKFGPGGRVVSISGYFCQPLYGPSGYAAEKAEMEAEIADIGAKIRELEADLEANPPQSPKSEPQAPERDPDVVYSSEDEESEGDAPTAMELALREAMKKARGED